MIEEFKLTLWDFYVFFLSGLVFCLLFIFYFAINEPAVFRQYFELIKQFSASQIVVAFPFFCVSVGLLIEPLANFFFRIVDKFLQKINSISKWTENKGVPIISTIFGFLNIEIWGEYEVFTKQLADIIKKDFLGDLTGKIENPYKICKIYVQDKDLSKEFMIFLARFGFYRNIAFAFVILSIFTFINYPNSLGLLLTLFLACVYKIRSTHFFGYQAPTIYSSYLIHHKILEKKEKKNHVPE